jgi:hypothetical protein
MLNWFFFLFIGLLFDISLGEGSFVLRFGYIFVGSIFVFQNDGFAHVNKIISLADRGFVMIGFESILR